jgi:hypothetical protein
MRWLEGTGRISSGGNEWALDYGCGHEFDADYYGMDRYDPYYYPDRSGLVEGTYDVITCNYVLNVIPTDDEIMSVLRDIRNLLNEGGVAYVTVRADTSSLRGWTKAGTFQRPVDIRGSGVVECKKKAGAWRMYVIQKYGMVTVE